MLKIKIPENKCSIYGEGRCQFFKSGYCDDDTWYSGNPYCYLYKKEIKEELKNSEEACMKEEVYFFNVDKPDFCKAIEITVVEKG